MVIGLTTRRLLILAGECERKSALREQVEDAAGEAAKIYDHYWRGLATLERTIGGDPLVRQLRVEVEAIRDLPPRDTSRHALSQAPSGAI